MLKALFTYIHGYISTFLHQSLSHYRKKAATVVKLKPDSLVKTTTMRFGDLLDDKALVLLILNGIFDVRTI